MVLLDNDIYYETKEIVLGKRAKSPLLVELSAWLRAKYSINVLNIQFSKLTLPDTDRYRLYIIIDNTADYQKMYDEPFEPNREYQEQIALEFQRLALKHRFTDKSNLENLFVIYNDFSDEAKTEANWKAEKQVETEIKARYPVVWDVMAIFSNLVVFYYSDAEIRVHENQGTNKAITDLYYLILKRYDDLDYFTRENIGIKFDSKENVDKNYQGSLFYYTRG